MARRNIASDETKRLQGRGKGRGKDYIPWLKVREVPSKGLSSRRAGKSEHVHHLLSKLETNYGYIQEFSDDVKEVRDQYPLDLNVTIAIAEEIGVRHPTVPRTGKLAVMTTDFLITLWVDGREIVIARALKYRKELTLRTRQKLEIERLYWERQGVDWLLVTENEISETAAKNIQWLLKSQQLKFFPNIDSCIVEEVEQQLYPLLNRLSAVKAYATADKMLGIERGTSLWVTRHLLATKRWRTCITKELLYKANTIRVKRAFQ